MAVKYSIPPQLRISVECQDLLARIFVANPAQRITLPEVKQHPWFLRNLPAELAVSSAADVAVVAVWLERGREWQGLSVGVR